MVINIHVEICMFMLKYFCGYHRLMKINQYEYLIHDMKFTVCLLMTLSYILVTVTFYL